MKLIFFPFESKSLLIGRRAFSLDPPVIQIGCECISGDVTWLFLMSLFILIARFVLSYSFEFLAALILNFDFDIALSSGMCETRFLNSIDFLGRLIGFILGEVV